MSARIDFETLVRGAGDAVVVAAPDGTIIFWNLAAARIFGHTEGEAVGRSLDLIIPERFRARHWNGYLTVMQTGHTKYGTDLLRVPALHKDGRRLSIAFSVMLLYSPTREIRGIAAIIRDETDRWEQERALRQRVSDLETKK